MPSSVLIQCGILPWKNRFSIGVDAANASQPISNTGTIRIAASQPAGIRLRNAIGKRLQPLLDGQAPLHTEAEAEARADLLDAHRADRVGHGAGEAVRRNLPDAPAPLLARLGALLDLLDEQEGAVGLDPADALRMGPIGFAHHHLGGALAHRPAIEEGERARGRGRRNGSGSAERKRRDGEEKGAHPGRT